MGLAPSRLAVVLVALPPPRGGDSLPVPRPPPARTATPGVTLAARARRRRPPPPAGTATALPSSRGDYYGDGDGDGDYGGYDEYGGYDGGGGEGYGYADGPAYRRRPPAAGRRDGPGGAPPPPLTPGAMPESRTSLPYNSRSDGFDAGGQAAYRADTFRRDPGWPQRDGSGGTASGRFGGGRYGYAGGGAGGGPPGAVGNPQSRAPSRDTSENFRTRSDGAPSVSRSNSNYSYGGDGGGFAARPGGGGGYDNFPGPADRWDGQGSEQGASLADMVSGYGYDPYKRRSGRGSDDFYARRPPPRQLNMRGNSIGSKYTPDRRGGRYDGGRYGGGMEPDDGAEPEDDLDMDEAMYDKLESGREYSRQMGRARPGGPGGRRSTIDVRGRPSGTVGRKDGFVEDGGPSPYEPVYGGGVYGDRGGPAGETRTRGPPPDGGGYAPPPPRSRRRAPPPQPIGLGVGRGVQRMFDALLGPFGLGGGMMSQMSEMERTMSAQFRSSEALLRDARESILSDPDVRSLIGDGATLGPPRRQSRSSSAVGGVTRSRMRIDVPCLGPDGRERGEARIVSDQDGIVRIEVSAGGRTVEVRGGGGGGGGRDVIDANVVDREVY